MDLQQLTVTELLGVITVYSPKGKQTTIKNRPSYGLSLCREGQIIYTHNGQDYVSDKDHAVLLPMGESYTLRRTETGYFPVINFLTQQPVCDRITLIELRNREILLTQYEELKKLFMHRGSRAKLLSIFYEMLYEIAIQAEADELQGALQAIYENYHLPTLTNACLAAECAISEVYFRKLFKQRMGISPRQFIIDLRIQKAKQLLSEGSLKIWAIAEACGFGDSYHFCKSFKQHTGMTPQEYRKSNPILAL
ncbi:MAG: helix-turn-helix domain-containing protein [Ruminococcaceae bacterium]|nr:helix-turn-helix domain-containing protein [Oscillospiraceae bacterium]